MLNNRKVLEVCFKNIYDTINVPFDLKKVYANHTHCVDDLLIEFWMFFSFFFFSLNSENLYIFVTLQIILVSLKIMIIIKIQKVHNKCNFNANRTRTKKE